MLRSTVLHVNGTKVEVDADPERPLLSVLRDELGLTGAKYGCGEGRCGACTVLLDGEPVRSCRARFGTVGSKEVTTVESLERDGKLHPVQQAFLDAGALQCGYCTCGMIMSAAALLQRNPDPGTRQIVEAMDGNVCRCGCYARIVSAILLAAKARKEAAR
jgi:aerobic-type carbon monoxide dehydrogenase small subunit (CoxS/CutS family)